MILLYNPHDECTHLTSIILENCFLYLSVGFYNIPYKTLL